MAANEDNRNEYKHPAGEERPEDTGLHAREDSAISHARPVEEETPVIDEIPAEDAASGQEETPENSEPSDTKDEPGHEDFISMMMEDDRDADRRPEGIEDNNAGGLNYEQRAIQRRLSEIGLMQEEIAQRRRDWFRMNSMLFSVIGGILAVVLIFVGIKFYNDSHHPISQLFSAASKNLSSSFSFNITAEKNGSPSMRYTGAAEFKPNSQSVVIAYDADYVDYQYRNVIYTDGQTTYKGNYYNGQWTIGDRTEKVQNYFDFYKNLKNGSFDGGSFLRFFEINADYSSKETTKFISLVKDRLSTDSKIAKITVSSGDYGKTYRYDISLEALYDLIIDRGASIFIRSTDYDEFVSKVEANRNEIAAVECALSFTVAPSGYLSKLEFSITTPDGPYVVKCMMSDFGNAEPDVPDAFFETAEIRKETD